LSRCQQFYLHVADVCGSRCLQRVGLLGAGQDTVIVQANGIFPKAPSDQQRLAEWNRKIPREAILNSNYRICDAHFDDRFILKTFDITVNV
jgi:hypothetical protein